MGRRHKTTRLYHEDGWLPQYHLTQHRDMPSEDTTKFTLKAMFKYYRAKMGFTVTELTQLMGYSGAGQITKIEQGVYLPGLYHYMRGCYAMGCSLDDLMPPRHTNIEAQRMHQGALDHHELSQVWPRMSRQQRLAVVDYAHKLLFESGDHHARKPQMEKVAVG